MSVINIYYHNENIYNVEKKPPERPPKPPLYHSGSELLDEFLKKNCGVRYRATKSAPVRLCGPANHKPPVPKKDEAAKAITPKCVDFKVENIRKVVNTSPKKVRSRYADTRKGDFHDLEKSGLLPVYKCQPKASRKNWENLQREYQSLPLLIDTVPKMIRKAKLEKGLKELEKDILTIENNPYIYVFDDEQQQNK
ncbi:hypothetical protein quinque_006238 [Culex quinquefasciatus]